MRFSVCDTVSGYHSTPVWKHRSGVNLTRDSWRQNVWIKNQEATREGERLNMENVWKTDQTENIKSGDSHIWNVHAPEFQVSPIVRPVMMHTCDSYAQTECTTESTTIHTQTETQGATATVGVQCKPDTNSIGIKCKIVQKVKSRCVQATAPMTTQGVQATTSSKDCSAQCDVRKCQKMCDVSVWCAQSPGAMSRHVQTTKIKQLDAKTTTDKVRMVTVATEMDNIVSDWEERVDCWEEVEDLLESEAEGYTETGNVGMDKSETLDSGQKQEYEGKLGLPDLLEDLGVSYPDMDQYAKRINDIHRNVKFKCIVQGNFKNFKGGGCVESQRYYAVLDDIVLPIVKHNNEYSVDRYIKLYGDCRSMLSSKDDRAKYIILKPNTDICNKCEKIAWSELESILFCIRSRHPMDRYSHNGGYEPYGGYGHRYGR